MDYSEVVRVLLHRELHRCHIVKGKCWLHTCTKKYRIDRLEILENEENSVLNVCVLHISAKMKILR